MSGRSVPAVVASTGTNPVFCLFFLGTIMASQRASDDVDSLFIVLFMLLLVLNLVAGVASVVALHRHPELVRLPAMPLTARSNRALWVCGWVVVVALALAALVPAQTPTALIVRLAALIGGMIIFNVLSRRGTGWHQREYQSLESLSNDGP